MHNMKKISQKITIIAFILLLIIQLLQPIVKAAIYDEEKYGKKPDGYIEIKDFESDYASQKGIHSYYKYTDEDKVQHVVAVEENGSEGNISRYQVSDTINESSGFWNLGKKTDPDVEKAKENINKNYGNSLGVIEVNKSATSTGIGTNETDSTSTITRGKRLSEFDVENDEEKQYYDAKHLKASDGKNYVIYYVGNEAYGLETKYNSYASAASSPVPGMQTEVHEIIDEELLKEVNEERLRNGQPIISGTANEAFDLLGTERQSQEQRGVENQSGIDPNAALDGGVEWIGGVLFRPLLDLLVSIGDAIINALQGTLMEADKMNNMENNPFKIVNYLLTADEQTTPPTYYAEEDGMSNANHIKVDTKEFHYGWLNLRNTFNYINAKYSPEEIFSNTSQTRKERRISAFNINFFSKSDDDSKLDLHEVISGWYLALRNLAIAGLLCVLAYIGIRILISATATDKAKYKQLLKDWLIALILLFTIHYIMLLTVTVVEAIVIGINPDYASGVTLDVETQNGGTVEYKTNLIGAARFQTQYRDLGRRMPYVVMYLALVVYTLIFTVYYFKRALTMAFLTMIAPLVALTYPIDKITDGKAQAFNAWLKDYVYNALLQPFHLIIYTVFVTNALNFAQSNAFYMIASLWFVLKAEQILRGYFGFSKASSGTMEALHTVGLASMLNNIAKGGPRLKGAANDSGKQAKEDDSIRFNEGVDATQLAVATGLGALSQGANQTGSQGANQTGSQGANQTGSQGANSTGSQGANSTGSQGANSTGSQGANASRRKATTNKKQKAIQKLWRTRTGGWSGIFRNARKMAPKAIKGAAKLGVRTAFKTGAGALAGAVALASGADLDKALAATAAGIGIGERAGNFVNNVGGAAINRAGEDLNIIFDDDDDIRRKEANKKMYDSNEYYNYIRSSMIKENNGVIPSAGEVEERLEEYRPFIERGFNIQEAEKAAKTADKMSADGTYGNIDYNEAAIMLATAKEREITRATLNKEADNLQARENLRAELKDEKKYTPTQIDNIVNKEFAFLEKNFGVASSNRKPPTPTPTPMPRQNSGTSGSTGRNKGTSGSTGRNKGTSGSTGRNKGTSGSTGRNKGNGKGKGKGTGYQPPGPITGPNPPNPGLKPKP